MLSSASYSTANGDNILTQMLSFINYVDNHSSAITVPVITISTITRDNITRNYHSQSTKLKKSRCLVEALRIRCAALDTSGPAILAKGKILRGASFNLLVERSKLAVRNSRRFILRPEPAINLRQDNTLRI